MPRCPNCKRTYFAPIPDICKCGHPLDSEEMKNAPILRAIERARSRGIPAFDFSGYPLPPKPVDWREIGKSKCNDWRDIGKVRL